MLTRGHIDVIRLNTADEYIEPQLETHYRGKG